MMTAAAPQKARRDSRVETPAKLELVRAAAREATAPAKTGPATTPLLAKEMRCCDMATD